MEHIIRRAGRYTYRRRVPAELVAKLGRREITRALGTANPKEAAVLARKVGVEIDAMFARLSAGGEAAGAAPAQPISWASAPLESHALEEQGVELEPWSELDQIMHRLKKLEETRPAPPAAPAATADTSASVEPASPSKTLSDILELWVQKRKPVATSESLARRLVARFTELNGDIPLRSITREHCKAYQASHTGAASSTRVYMSNLKALLSLAIDEGWLSTNPAQGIKTEQDRHAKLARMPFDTEELRAVLAHAKAQPKTSHRHWLPLIGTYTGMRLEEIGGLRGADIRQETYTDATGARVTAPFIYVTEEHGRRLKNAASVRRIPVHHALIEAGLIELAKRQGDKLLFADLTVGKDGRVTGPYANWFGRQLRNVIKITDTRKTFHSTRHNAKDALREAGVPEQVSDALMGHTTGSVSRSYGGAFFPARPLCEAIQALTYHL